MFDTLTLDGSAGGTVWEDGNGEGGVMLVPLRFEWGNCGDELRDTEWGYSGTMA